jgi:hypothetical protein
MPSPPSYSLPFLNISGKEASRTKEIHTFSTGFSHFPQVQEHLDFSIYIPYFILGVPREFRINFRGSERRIDASFFCENKSALRFFNSFAEAVLT